MDNGDLLHVPNLCVFKTCCSDCISTEAACIKCGDASGQRIRVSMSEEHNPANKEPVEWFMEFVLEKRKVNNRISINISSNFLF